MNFEQDELGQLSRLKHLQLYGSRLVRMPRTIGNLASLEYLDLYTAYDLHYLPFELTACSRLVRTRFSTRTVFANPKTFLPLPVLPRLGDQQGDEQNVCSVCRSAFNNSDGCCVWSVRVVGTDQLALLAFCCSAPCAENARRQGEATCMSTDMPTHLSVCCQSEATDLAASRSLPCMCTEGDAECQQGCASEFYPVLSAAHLTPRQTGWAEQ